VVDLIHFTQSDHQRSRFINVEKALGILFIPLVLTRHKKCF